MMKKQMYKNDERFFITDSAFFKHSMKKPLFKLCVLKTDLSLAKEIIKNSTKGLNYSCSNDEYIDKIKKNLKKCGIQDNDSLVVGLDFVNDMARDNNTLSHLSVDRVILRDNDSILIEDGGHRRGICGALLQKNIYKGADLLVTTNRIEDENYGSLEKEEIYKFTDGKYELCYQAYNPCKDYVAVDEVVKITKDIQKRKNTASEQRQFNSAYVKQNINQGKN